MRRFFNRLYGNDSLKNRLSTAILTDRYNHALLICGPSGSGKKTLALEICAALNCLNAADDRFPLPCGGCNNCRRIYEDNYPDIKRLKKDASKATIGVEELREFREDMFLSAVESEHKIYIIDQADKMTPNAQNALLKVLEEPPPAVIILLLCEEADKILTTIKSRAQLAVMQRFGADEIVSYLLSKGEIGNADKDKVKENLSFADGRIGKAIEILRSPDGAENDRRITLDVINALKRGSPYSELYSAIGALPQKRVELGEALDLICVAISDLIKCKLSKDAMPLFFTNAEQAREICDSIGLKKLTAVYDVVRDTAEDNSKNANVSAMISCLGAKIKLI
ncbi:MAG: AAA family ATPase [Clostridia bacterium]|nr:AAA family ATPase [Clostridia bacterium]